MKLSRAVAGVFSEISQETGKPSKHFFKPYVSIRSEAELQEYENNVNKHLFISSHACGAEARM